MSTVLILWLYSHFACQLVFDSMHTLYVWFICKLVFIFSASLFLAWSVKSDYILLDQGYCPLKPDLPLDDTPCDNTWLSHGYEYRCALIFWLALWCALGRKSLKTTAVKYWLCHCQICPGSHLSQSDVTYALNLTTG